MILLELDPLSGARGRTVLPRHPPDCTTGICHNLPMCGRYKLSRRKPVVEEYFDCGSDEPDWTPRYNVAPTQLVPVIRQNPRGPVRELSLVRWALIPSWAKDSSVAARMINARSETAGTKPAFRDALEFRRCLIPGDGFYEWSRTAKGNWTVRLQRFKALPTRIRATRGEPQRRDTHFLSQFAAGWLQRKKHGGQSGSLSTPGPPVGKMSIRPAAWLASSIGHRPS
jgi:hypothetical protein